MSVFPEEDVNDLLKRASQITGTSFTPAPKSLSEDEDLAVRTIIGEAKHEGQRGWNAVAGVIRNRANRAGQSLKDVVLSPNQFEPWSSRKKELEGYDPNSPTYRQVARSVLPILRGDAPDPTGGATHFYSPTSQAALGRTPPAWDNGTGIDIGNHRFFKLSYGANKTPANKTPSAPSFDYDSLLAQASKITGSQEPDYAGLLDRASQVTAAPMPVPEAPETINAQAQAAADPTKPRAAVLLNPNEVADAQNDPKWQGFAPFTTNDGRMMMVNLKAAKKLGLKDRDHIQNYILKNDRAMEAFGIHAETVGDTSQGAAVHTTAPDGTELNSSIVTTPQTAEQQINLDQTNHPGSTSQVVDAQDVVAKRLLQPTPERSVVGEIAALPPESLHKAVWGETPSSADFKTWARYKKLPTTPANRKVFEKELARAGSGSVTASAQVNAPTTDTEAVRVPLTLKAGHAPSDEDILNSSIHYDVDIPQSFKGDKTQYALAQTRAALKRDFGLTDEQTKEIATVNGPVTTNAARMNISRKELAKYAGLDKVKADYDRERAQPTLEAFQQTEAQNAQQAPYQVAQDIPALKPTGDNLLDQAKANIWADPFTAHTDESIQREYERLQRTTPDEEERRGLETAGRLLNQLDQTGILTGATQGAAWLGDITTGALKLSPIGLLEYATGYLSGSDINAKMANRGRVIAQASSDADTVLFQVGDEKVGSKFLGRALGQAAIQIPVYVGMSTLPGGAIMTFAATEGLGAVGRGENALDVAGHTIKGGVLGAVFQAAPRIGQVVEQQAGRAFVNPVFEAGKQLSGKQVLASKLLGTVAEMGTIGGGTFYVEKASGASTDEAFRSAVVNTLFGLTKHIPFNNLVGKTYRMHDGTNSEDVTIDPDGSVKLLPKGKVPPGGVDAEFDVSKVVEMKPDAEGVYRATSDTTQGERARLGEAPAKRIEKPLPEAVQKVPLDNRAVKIADALTDGEAKTIQELAKATRYNPAKVNETIELLYGAGKVEITPDNKVRLVEPLEKGATSLYEQFNEKGKVATPVTDTKAPKVPQAPVKDTLTSETAPKPEVPLDEREPQWTPPKEYEPAPTTTMEQARREGKYSKDGVEYVRQEPLAESASAVTGKSGKLRFADAEPDPSFKYRLIEADQLQPADLGGKENRNHFLPEAQPKDRSTAASKMASDKIAQAPDIEQVAEAPNAYSGAPVINPRGEVIQGNNRAEGLKKHYGLSGTIYKDDLKKHADRFGFTPEQVEGMTKPVLVRQVDAEDADAIRLGQYTMHDLESGGSVRINPVTTAARIPHEKKAAMVDDIFRNAPEDATLKTLIRDNRDLIKVHLDPYLTNTQKETLENPNKEFTPDAVKDIEQVFTHFLFSGGAPELPDLFDALPHNTKEGLIASLPRIFGVPQAESLAPDLQHGITAANRFKTSGNDDWDTWVRQPDMVDNQPAPIDIYTPLELELAKKLLAAKTQKDVKDIFSQYAKVVNGTSGELFEPDREPQSKAVAVKEVFGVDHVPRKAETESTGSGASSDKDARPVEPEAETTRTPEPEATEPDREELTPKPKLKGTPPAELDAPMRTRILYAKERGMTVSDIAQRYNVTPEQIKAAGALPQVGESGQMSHRLIQVSIPAKQATDTEIAEKTEFVNDLAAELTLPIRLERGQSLTEDYKNASDTIRKTIAEEMGKERASQLSQDDWFKWMDAHADRLNIDTVETMLDALGFQTEHTDKVNSFLSNKDFGDILDKIDESVGLANLKSFKDIPNRDDRSKILALAKQYGIRTHALTTHFNNALSRFIEERNAPSVSKADRPTIPSAGKEEPQAAGAGERPRNAEELDDIQFTALGSRSPTQTQAFKQWFADSKVVDENGDPLLVHHGGAPGVEVFDSSRSGEVNYSDWGPGIYFTPPRWMAESYRRDWAKKNDTESSRMWDELVAKSKEYGTDPISAWIDLGKSQPEKYAELQQMAEAWKARRAEIEDKGGEVYDAYVSLQNPLVHRWQSGMITDSYLTLLARSKGHDGVIILTPDGRIDEVIAFESNQIKSASKNRGTFDPNEPSILKSEQPDLFGGISTLTTSQPSMFDVRTEAVPKLVEPDVQNDSVDYIKTLTESENPKVAKTAKTVEKLARRGDDALQSDAADALDIYSRAVSTNTPIGDMVRQLWLDEGVKITSRSERLATAMASGTLGRVWIDEAGLPTYELKKYQHGDWRIVNRSTPEGTFLGPRFRSKKEAETFADTTETNIQFNRPKEQTLLKKVIKRAAKQSESAIVSKARIEAMPNELLLKNPEALITAVRTIRSMDTRYGNTNFIGAYLNRDASTRFVNHLRAIEGQALAFGDIKGSRAIGNIADAAQKAIENNHGDLILRLAMPKEFPGLTETTRQEELAHRTIARTGRREDILLSIDTGDTIEKLGEGYENMSDIGKADEAVAKQFREDAPEIFGINKKQSRSIRLAFINQAFEKGVDSTELAKNLEQIPSRAGQAGARYVRKVASQRSGRDVEAEPERTAESSIDDGGSRGIRRARFGDRGRDTLRETERLSALRQASVPRPSGSTALSPKERVFIEKRTKGNAELARAVENEVQFARLTDEKKWTIGDYAIDLLNIPKALKSSVDLSASGRQGWIAALAHPKIAAKAFRKQLLSAVSAQQHKTFARDLNLHPFIELAEESGLFLAHLAGENMNEREEAFMTSILGENRFFKNNKFEVARKLASLPIRASERAYTTFLDDLRINTFGTLAKKMHEANVRRGRPDDTAQYRAIATFINYSTGRGDLGAFNDAAKYLNAGFFSARYWASRLQVMNPFFYRRIPPGARSLILKDLMSSIVAMAVIGLLLKLAGAKIDYDNPDDPNTLKIGFGDYTYDISAGLLKHLRYAARMIMATQDKDPTRNMAHMTERYIRSSVAPVPGAAWSALSGKNYVGEPTDWKKEGKDLFVPIMVDNFKDAATAEGVPGVIKLTPELFGISTTRYKGLDELIRLKKQEPDPAKRDLWQKQIEKRRKYVRQ